MAAGRGDAGDLPQVHSPAAWHRLAYASLFLLVLCATGTAGYVLIEGWAPFDALFMTVISMTTVGYGETHPLSHQGRIFTIALLVVSVGIMGYAVSTLAAFVLEGDLNRMLRGRRMHRQISALTDHLVLCGGGHAGRHVAEEFHKTRTPFVVIERDPEALGALRRLGDVPFVDGDATQDDVLRLAGIERARGLVAALGEDKENVFIVLSARALNPRLRIVARLVDPKNAEKLRKAGADEAVSADAIGGLRMASVMIRPSVVSFLDQMLRVQEATLRMEEVAVPAGSPLAGQPLRDWDLRRRTGLLVVALRRGGAVYEFNPPAEAPVAAGDVIIVMGTTDQVESARRLATGAA